MFDERHRTGDQGICGRILVTPCNFAAPNSTKTSSICGTVQSSIGRRKIVRQLSTLDHCSCIATLITPPPKSTMVKATPAAPPPLASESLRVVPTLFSNENGNLKYVAKVVQFPRTMLAVVCFVCFLITYLLQVRVFTFCNRVPPHRVLRCDRFRLVLGYMTNFVLVTQ